MDRDEDVVRRYDLDDDIDKTKYVIRQYLTNIQYQINKLAALKYEAGSIDQRLGD
jgi:hypothetical protein